MGVLQDRPQGAAQRILPDGGHRDAVVGDDAAFDLIKPVDQVGNRRLSRSGGAYKGDFLSRIGVDGHVLQNTLTGDVGEIHMAEPYGSPQLRQPEILTGDAAHRAPDGVQAGFAVGVRVFPGPAALRVFGQVQAAGLGDLPGPGPGPSAAGIDRQFPIGVLLRRDQRNDPLVHLRRGVHHLKNPLRTGHRRQQGRHLLGNLVQGLAHLLGVVEIDHQSAQVKALEDGNQSPEGGGEGVADVH